MPAEVVEVASEAASVAHTAHLSPTLLVAPAWIGDAVLAQPLLARLHAATPGLVIDALAPRWVAPVLARMPQIRQVIDSPYAHGELALAARWRLARQLAASGYQRAIVLPNSLKSALIPFFAGIPERIGFTGEARLGLLNRRLTLDKAAWPTMAERFAALGPQLGTGPLPNPQLRSTPEQQAATLATIGRQRPSRLVIACPGAEYGPAKRWPAAHFATLIGELRQRGISVWLLGSNKDRAVGEEILAQLPPGDDLHNLCGATSLDQAIDLIAAADAVVCNDSGLMHVAAALDRPLVALYGSSSPGFTPPLSTQAQVLSLQLSCSPCFERNCPLGHLDCLQKLSPATVLNRLLPSLSEPL